MRLTPEQRAAILAEMRLAELFNTKRWAERYQISPRQVKQLRALARDPLYAPKGQATTVEVRFTVNGPTTVKAA